MENETCSLCEGSGIVYCEDELVGYGRDAVIEPVEYACPKCSERSSGRIKESLKELDSEVE